MMRFRPKLGSERGREWRCCYCLHVRTGTILIGTWHLMLHLVALVFLAAIVRDPRLMAEVETDSRGTFDYMATVRKLQTPVDETGPTRYPHHGAMPRDHSLIYMCTLTITLMLIYGAARGKPAHLLPFFCLQIFDFAITVLTATGYLCYLRSIHGLVAETRRVPWTEELLQLPAPALAVIVLSAFLLAILIKGYCINVVWRCYKYCTWRAATLHSLTPFVISSEGALGPLGAGAAPPPAPAYCSLLPDYEEAIKQTPPPSYQAATLMAAAQPYNVVPIPETPNAESPPTDTMVVLPQPGAQVRV